MKLLRLDAIAERYPYRLSGGEKKRVAIASVVTVDPDVYLMDEPTANLDPATEGILIDLLADLAERGKTLVIATQDLLLARHIGAQAIVLGPDRTLITKAPVMEILEDHALLEKAGLVHAHRAPHGAVPTAFKHTHYTREDDH
jgi:cobalt/nickel transport system ATP-binding protein